MSISSASNRVFASGNGVTTAFSTLFQFISASDLKVYIQTVDGDDIPSYTLKTITTHYTVSGGDSGSGPATGTVTFLSAPAVGETVIIINDPPAIQSLDFIEGDSFSSRNTELGLDKAVLIAQRAKELAGQALRLPLAHSAEPDFILPPLESLKGKFLYFDPTGIPIGATEVDGDAASAFGASLIDDASASDALTTLGFSTYFKTLVAAANLAGLNTLLGYAANVKSILEAADYQAIRTLLGFSVSGGLLPTSLIGDGQVTGSKRVLTVSSSQTADFTAAAGTELYLCNASSATINVTLPAAASHTGRTFRFRKTNAELSSGNSVSLEGGTWLLASQNEQIELTSNGSAWIVTNRYIPSEWTSYTPTFNALGTVSSVEVRWRRAGSNIQINGRVTAGTPTAADFTLTLPSPLELAFISSTKILVGGAFSDYTGAGYSQLFPKNYIGDPSKIAWGDNVGKSGFDYAAGSGFLTGGIISFWVEAPIGHWQG